MKIKSIGQHHPLAGIGLEHLGVPLGPAQVHLRPQVLSGVVGLSSRRSARIEMDKGALAPRQSISALRSVLSSAEKEKDSTSTATSPGIGLARNPVRVPRRRAVQTMQEPDHHDIPHVMANSSSAESRFQALQVVVGHSAEMDGLVSPEEVHKRELPVDQANAADTARFGHARERRGQNLAMLKLLTSLPLAAPVPDPRASRPELYTPQAKAELKQRITAEGSAFRSTPAERQEFREAFLFLAQEGVQPQERPFRAAVALQAFDKLMGAVTDIQDKHPELKDIPAEDLAALRAFTGPHRAMVEQALQGDPMPGQPPANALGLAFAKCVVSALHALPAAYHHKGQVFTQVSDRPEGLRTLPPRGQERTDWSFLSASQGRPAKPHAGQVILQTLAHNAKNITALAIDPQHQELVFPPGTRFKTTHVDFGKPGTGQATRTVHQTQLSAQEQTRQALVPPSRPPLPLSRRRPVAAPVMPRPLAAAAA